MLPKWLQKFIQSNDDAAGRSYSLDELHQGRKSVVPPAVQSSEPAAPIATVPLVMHLEGFEVGDPVQYEALTLFPIYQRNPRSWTYHLLQEALETEAFHIEELNNQGSVPLLRAVNQLPDPILVLDGEELVGAKQNRITNASFLLAPNQSTQLPVSCVEQGRWAYKGKRFQSGQTIYAASARRRKHQTVSQNLRQTQTFISDQGQVWKDVASYLHKSNTNSGTANYSDYIRKRQDAFDAYEEALPYKDGQVGQVVFLKERFLALDTLDQPHKAKVIYPKLLRSYSQEAIDELSPPPVIESIPFDDKAGMRVFEVLWQMMGELFPSVSLGRDLRFKNDEVTGAALLYKDHLAHLQVFPAS